MKICFQYCKEIFPDSSQRPLFVCFLFYSFMYYFSSQFFPSSLYFQIVIFLIILKFSLLDQKCCQPTKLLNGWYTLTQKPFFARGGPSQQYQFISTINFTVSPPAWRKSHFCKILTEMPFSPPVASQIH